MCPDRAATMGPPPAGPREATGPATADPRPDSPGAAQAADPPFDLAHFLPHRLSVLSRLTQGFLASVLDASGMTVAQWRVFICLTLNGPSHLNGVAAFTRLPQSSLSRSIAQMAERGLVKNARDPGDRRVARIELTGKGRKQFAALTKKLDAACEAVFAMAPHEEAAFLHTIDELIARLSARMKPPDPSRP